MAVNWGLAGAPGGGFDYLDSLREIGNLALQKQQQQFGDMRLQQGRTQMQAREQAAGMARGGDFAGARQAAALGGDFDFYEALGGLDKDKQGRLQQEFDTIETLSNQLRTVPPEQRAAYGIPLLKQAGFNDAELADVDWSDRGLDAARAFSSQGKAALKQQAELAFELAKPRVVGSGGALVANGQVVYQQPKEADWVFDSESGSWLMKPGTGSPGVTAGMPGGQSMTQPQQTDQGVFNRMVSAESGGRQFASGGGALTSPKGAVGIAQVMPGTAPEAARLAGLPWDAQRYRGDPEYNRALGEAYYNKQLADFGDPMKAAAAYNAGPNRVREAVRKGGPNWQQHIPAETQAYLNKVFGGQGAPGTPGVINVRPPKSKQDTPPSGYRWRSDGTQEPIPGGPADPRRETVQSAQNNRKAEGDLRKQFDALPEVKNFKTARQQYYSLRDIALNPSASAADDIAVIFSFMRTLDPTSTVREGEFATAQNAAGIPDRLRNYYNQLAQGNRLNPQQRRDMVATAFKGYARFRDAYNTAAESYRGYARDYGVSPDNVARTYTPDRKPGDKPKAALQKGQTQKLGNGITIKALN